MALSETLSAPIGVRAPMPGVRYPPPEALARYVALGYVQGETLIGAWREAFARNRGRPALLTEDRVISYASLDQLSDRAAWGFHKLGLQPLDRVAFQVANSANLVVALLGCLKAGLIPLCTLHSHRRIEMEGLGGHAEIRAHFVDTTDARFDFLEFSRALRKSLPSLQVTVVVNGPGAADAPTLDALCAESAEDAEASAFVSETVARLDPYQVAFFQISGGSTGVPKIIPRLQNDYIANLRATQAATGITKDDCILAPGPLLHNAGLSCFWGPALLSGARLAIPPSLEEDALVRLFQEARPTWLYLPKPLLPRLVAVLDRAPEARAAIRGVVTSSGAAQVEAQCGVPALQFFGMTEGVIAFTRPGESPARRHETIGWPVSLGDEVRVLKPGTEEDAAPGEAGELVLRGPYTLHGYYNAEAQNLTSFTSDGWLRSGDLVRLAHVDDAPALVFEGRLKDLINRGGEKISCEEVERLVRTHPGVRDVAVAPAPCPIYGERGLAFVIAAANQPLVTLADLTAHLGREGLAKYKWPEHLVHIEQFPTTGVAKLNREALKAMAAQALASDPSDTRRPVMPNLTLSGVHHTARPTWRLEETVKFYRDILGLDLIHAITARGWGREGHPDFLHFFFDSGRGSTIAFFYYLGTERPDYLEPRADHNYRSTHTAWQVDTPEQLLAWKAKLEAAGLEVSPVTNHEVIDSIYFHDPNGYNIEIAVQTRAFAPVDGRDAELTLQAAIALEAEGKTLAPGADIDTIWRRKADLVKALS